jgi:nucleoside-diphosphate-sugar epimerase
MDPSRARLAFGWEAQTALREGLHATYRALVKEFASDAAAAATPG